MEETPLVYGEIISDQTCISDKDMIHELDQKGFGEIEKEKLFLKQFETLYLLYTKRLILKKNKKQIDFDSFMGICQKTDF
ncbi:MAG: tRNA-intron lyase, partial [Nitrosopumilus sp.]|nr:tRNA-intron lyase [Nitrosopumilus sp.]